MTSSTPVQPSTENPIILNGVQYIPDPMWSRSQSSTSSTPSAYITETSEPTDYPYRTFLALSDDPPSLSGNTAFSAQTLIGSDELLALLFILDSGATCHISPNASDFQSLHPITPHPIKGLGGVSIDAVATGTIELNCQGGKLILQKAFYVPKSSVCLISVFLLNNPSSGGHYSTHFYSQSVYITDHGNSIIAQGTAMTNRKLYALSHFTMHVNSTTRAHSYAHYTTYSPDVDSWHKHLGHCNTETIIQMAHSHAAEGMPIDLSIAPPKCESCILGKQTQRAVPKVQEGAKAGVPLERIYVDLTGPMSIPSYTGRLYSMNIIDDFSNFIWSLPLHSKSEASTVFKHWLTTVQLHTPHKLKHLISDNGELTSIQVRDICAEHGILHHFTAPYTSAQNGHAERLHHTLMDKARAMRIACKAPINMWDKFCATSAYLTNADILMKPLGPTDFTCLRHYLGIRSARMA